MTAHSTTTVGVAVVGAGYWGPNLIRNFARCGLTDLRWVVDLDVDRARAVLGDQSQVRVTASLDDVLGDPTVAAVAIATPPASHLPIAMSCLAAGKHLLIEKPLATSSADGRRIVEEAERLGLVVMTDHTFCYTPVARRIRELVHSGQLGEIHYFDSIRVNLGLVQSDVDVFWDLTPHDLSILDFVLPADVTPVSVSAIGADPIGAGQSCVGYLTMPLTSGGIAHVSVNWLSPSKIRQVVIAGSQQMLVWDDMKPYQRLAIVDRGVELHEPAIGAEKQQLMVDYRIGDMVIPALNETSEALMGVVEEFASSIQGHRKPLTDGHAGLRVLHILEAATESLGVNGALVPLEV